MLGIVTMAGNALRAFGNTHPAVKWGVIVLALLLAFEFVGREGIELYARMATVQSEVKKKNLENQAGTVGDLLADQHKTFGASNQPVAPQK